jgi:hypothetical protein
MKGKKKIINKFHTNKQFNNNDNINLLYKKYINIEIYIYFPLIRSTL